MAIDCALIIVNPYRVFTGPDAHTLNSSFSVPTWSTAMLEKLSFSASPETPSILLHSKVHYHYFHCYTVQLVRTYKLLNQLFALASFCSKNFYTFKTFLHLLKY